MLEKGNWQEDVYQKLQALLVNHREQGEYAVFDWDNTCIINDIGEAVFNYQLRQLDFHLTPEELLQTLLTGVPKDPFNQKWQNQDGEVLDVESLASDIAESYERLFHERKAGQSVVTLQQTLDYLEFITKMRFLYDAIGDSFSPDISYPWVTYFLGGKTEEEVQQLTLLTLEEELRAELGFERWTSPASVASKSGCVTIQFKRGIRLIPEIQGLMKALESQGIKVYIVSASNRDVILSFATAGAYGYALPDQQVYGMRLKSVNGKQLPRLDERFAQTQGKGKTRTIQDLIAPFHGNRGPVLVAGDSDGDVAMLSDFQVTEVALIIDRQKKGQVGELVKQAGQSLGESNQRYFVQGRDEIRGCYINQTSSILLT